MAHSFPVVIQRRYRLTENGKGEINEFEDGWEVGTDLRELPGRWHYVVLILGILSSLFHIWINTIGVMPGIYRNAVHLGFIFTLAFLLYPAYKKKPKKALSIDIFFCLVVCLVTLYILLFEEELHLERASIPILRDHIVSACAVVIVLIGTQRVMGWIIPAMSLIFISYALFLGKFIPGLFNFAGVALGRLLYRMYLTDEGIFGMICTVSSTYVYIFILFGAFLVKSGASKFMIELSQSLTGRTVGGPAKIAVVSSGFMGSVSGSPVANVMTTGSVTIPMMKQIGLRPAFAGAVEAAASTGGQLMPPIMGSGAFIMASWTGISYLKIIAVSAIPAIMYFLSVMFFVHIEVLKLGIKPLNKEEIPELKKVLKEGADFLIPIALLVFLLVEGFTPTYAGTIATFAIVAVSWFRKKNRMGLRDILDALYIGAKNSISTCAMLMCAGMVIGIVGLTGMGVTFSGMIIDLSGGHLSVALILVMLASLILGMGLPVTASYVFLAVLAAPSLENMGISLLAAHLIIFWFSQDALVTPPVCLASFAAAGIAGSKPMETGFISWKLAKGLYIIPFLFAYTPILFEGPLYEVLITAVSATLGLLAFTATLERHLVRTLFLWETVLIGLATVGLLWPNMILRIVGFLIFASIYLPQKLMASRQTIKLAG